MPFDQRIVMVTGAAGNLGRAVAAAFEALGATVVRLGRKDPIGQSSRILEKVFGSLQL